MLFTHDAGLNHDTGPMHPERPDRLRAVLKALAAKEFSSIERREAPEATVEQIARIHPESYVEAILDAIPSSGTRGLDGDTIVSPGSGEAALRASGAACAAVDAVIAGDAGNAFCATRPPGHHAEPTTAMGFCLFNNVAVAARHAQAVHGLERVAVMDFDVHHGNGTQAAFWDDPSLLYTSTHQMPLYPGTGAIGETGIANNIVNAPLAPQSDGVAFKEAMTGRILPALDSFAPDLLIISAGFDAHYRDPLASLNFDEDDFYWATRELMALADRVCGGRVVSCLEGGYDLQGLATSAAAHVRALLEPC
jgi:acetoin utilization deacetylase AcuC-like enzyme